MARRNITFKDGAGLGSPNFRSWRPAIRTLRGWSINVLLEAGAIREDPGARQRALDIARQDPPPRISYQAAAVAIGEVLDPIGDTCPECQSSD